MLVIDCPVILEEEELVVFELEHCSSCELVKKKLSEHNYQYKVIDLKTCKRVEGYDGKVIVAPTIFIKRNGKVELIL